MAWVSKEIIQEARDNIKNNFKGWGITLRKQHTGTLIATIRKMPKEYHDGLVDFVNSKEGYENYSKQGYIHSQHFLYILSEIDKEKSRILEDCLRTSHFFDKSDIMTDYFYCSHYYYAYLGAWDKPYILNKELTK